MMSDAIGAELAQLAREIWAWQQATFGDGCTVHGAVAKIRDECAEVLECEEHLAKWKAVRHAGRREELADVFFMLVQMTGAAGSAHVSPGHPSIQKYRADSALAYSLGRVDGSAHAFLRAHEWGSTASSHAATAAWLDACAANDDLPHMPAAIRAKLEENRARTWAKPAADGTISHVKGGER